MVSSSIYHRHIEHFFHIFGGSTVFSLISESVHRLYSSCPWLGWVSFPLRVSCLMTGQGTEFHSSTSQKKTKCTYLSRDFAKFTPVNPHLQQLHSSISIERIQRYGIFQIVTQ